MSVMSTICGAAQSAMTRSRERKLRRHLDDLVHDLRLRWLDMLLALIMASETTRRLIN